MLENRVIENILNAALSTGGDFAEVFVEDRNNMNINLIGGKIKKDISGKDYGAGIRIFHKLNSIYAYTNDLSEENLIKVAKEAAASIKESKINLVENFINLEVLNNTVSLKKFSDVDKKNKIDLLREGYEAAKNYSEFITQVTSNYMEYEQDILVANSEGIMARDKRNRTRYSISSIATKNNEQQTGSYSPGASSGFEFYDNIDVKEVGKEASRIAVTSVNADNCPSGVMPVIIDNEFGGVLFHEACGHSLEAEFVSKGISVFGDKLGKQIASPLLTAIDDGTLNNQWGTTSIDDEGTPTKKNILIENGILKSFLVDKLNGLRMNIASTGSGRRQSYKYAPTSRMNNTYIASGRSKLKDMISSMDYGLYAKKLGGGSVNPTTGEFNFAVMEGYIIKNGKVEKPVRGATLIGKGSEVLMRIDMIGNNLEMGQGMCGASSGSIPVNVGQPAIRISSMTVGGREDK